MLNKKWFVSCLLLLGTVGSVYAQTDFASQTTFSENGECAACSVTNPQFPVDANTSNFSSIEAVLGDAGGYIEQTLIFNNNGAIGDSLVIGIQLDSALDLSSVDNIYFETFVGSVTNNDRRLINDPAMGISTTMLNNRYDLYFLTSYPYDRVSIRVETGGTADTVRLFYANKTKAVGLPTGPCQKPVAQSVTVSTSCSGCGISNPNNAADSDELSFATFSVTNDLFGAGLVEQNYQFGEAGFSGDTVRFFIEDPSGNLAANGFSNLEIRTALGPDDNNDTKVVGTIDAPFVNTGGNFYTLKFVARNTFDIATLRMNTMGSFGATNSFNIYYLCRVSKDTPPDTIPCQQSMFESNGADAACTGCQVNNPNNAVDGDDATFSTISLGALATSGDVYQEFELPFIGGDGDRFTVRMSNPAGNINSSNLGNLSVETMIGQVENNDRRTLVESDLTVLGGPNNLYEYTFEGFLPYDRLRVSLTGGGDIEDLNIYFVCNRDYNVDSTLFNPCSNADSTSNSSEALCTNCDVTGPVNVLDNDDDSYSLISTADGAFPAPPNIGSVEQTIIFPRESCGKDSVKIVLSSDDLSGDTSMFSSVTVYLFNNPGPAQDTVATVVVSGDDLSQIPNTTKFGMFVSPGTSFSAVQMKVTVTAGEHRNIRWYSACMTNLYPARPTITSMDLCYDESVTLFANVNQPDVVPTWWTAATGGTLIHTGTSYTTPPLQDDTTFYVQATDSVTGCVSSIRRAINIQVFIPVPDAVLPVSSDSLCFGEFVTIIPKPYGNAFNFYTDPNGDNKIYNGTELYLFPIISDSVIYVQNISGNGCESAVLVPFNIYLKPTTPNAVLKLDTITVCKGGFTDLVIMPDSTDTVPATYFWYTEDFGGQQVYTGDSLRLNNILQDTLFYVERVSDPCGPALERTLVHVFAIDELVTTVPNDSVFVCPDSMAVVEAVSDIPGAEILWYDAAVGGNQIGSGSPFMFAQPNDTSVTVYAASKLDQCEESSREAVTVYNVDTLLKLMAYDTTICFGQDLLIGVRPVENGASVTWWDAPTGGTALGIGDSLQITSATDSLIYYAQVDYSSACPAIRVPVTVNVIPEIVLSLVQDTIYYCSNEMPTFMVNKSFDTLMVSWFNTQNGTGLIGQGDDFTFNPVGDTTTIWFEGNFRDCNSGPRQSATAIFADQLAIPVVRDTIICEGLPITLIASVGVPASNLVWYDQASGGSIIGNGGSFTTAPLFNDTIFYVGVDLGTYCNNLPRVPIEVSITNQLVPPTALSCDALAATLTSVRFNWIPNPNAVGYQVSVDGGPWIASNTGSSHIVGNLHPEDCVSLSVRAIGSIACETSTALGPITCCAKPCDSIPAYILQSFETCLNEPITITVIGDPLNRYDYSFNGGPYVTNKSFTYSPTASGTFEVRIRNKEAVAQAECPIKTMVADITVHPRPVVDFTIEPASPIVEGTDVNLFNVQFTGIEPTGATFYHYTLLDQSSNIIGQGYSKDGTVAATLPPGFDTESDFFITACLRVDDENGCDTEVCKTDVLRVFKVKPIVIPNGFTPDASTNNTLSILHEEGFVDLESFIIFNKYGNIVFETTRIDEAWDGRNKLGEPQPSGVYVYTAKVRDDANQIKAYQGSVTLIR